MDAAPRPAIVTTIDMKQPPALNEARKEIQSEIDRLRRESSQYFRQSQELRRRTREIDARIQDLMKKLRETPH